MTNQQIIIEITQELVDEYNKEYLKTHPRSKKNRIESPLCINFNTYNSKGNRIIQNNYKQEWKAFIIWICEKQEISNMNIDNCTIHCHFIYPTKMRHDLDNSLATTLKFSQDALVEAKVITEDTYTILKEISATGSYEKGIKKTIITINY